MTTLDTLRRIHADAMTRGPASAIDPDLDREAGMDGNYGHLLQSARNMDSNTPPHPTFLAVYIGTTNDTNGNPRRGWYVSRLDGAPMLENAPTDRKGETAPAWTCWVEEGYNGTAAPVNAIASLLGMPARTWNDIAAVKALIHETGRIEVTPAEYRSARKLPRVGGAT